MLTELCEDVCNENRARALCSVAQLRKLEIVLSSGSLSNTGANARSDWIVRTACVPVMDWLIYQAWHFGPRIRAWIMHTSHTQSPFRAWGVAPNVFH